LITLYGIPNCDTVSKARKWLSSNNIEHQFHNFKKDGLEKTTLEYWINQLGWQTILNKRSMSWRNLDDDMKIDIDDDKAMTIILSNLSIIKRPVLDKDGTLCVGFKDEQYQSIFQ